MKRLEMIRQLSFPVLGCKRKRRVKKGEKRQIIRVFLMCMVIILILLFKEQYQWEKYEEEYDNAEWYEVTAEYERSRRHTKREKHRDPKGREYYEVVEYYDWYYTYTAEDGSVHSYVETNSPIEGSGGTITILVDKNDPSHAIEPKKEETHSRSVKLMIKMLIVCVIVTVGLIVFCSCVGRLRKKLRRR